MANTCGCCAAAVLRAVTLFSILDENDSPLLSENAFVFLGLGATCTGAHDGSTPASCVGADDGTGQGQACVLNAEESACAVDGGDCVFSAQSGSACTLNGDESGCAVAGGECVYSAYNPSLAQLQMDPNFIESNQMHAINGFM